jgi:hypothetical protein
MRSKLASLFFDDDSNGFVVIESNGQLNKLAPVLGFLMRFSAIEWPANRLSTRLGPFIPGKKCIPLCWALDWVKTCIPICVFIGLSSLLVLGGKDKLGNAVQMISFCLYQVLLISSAYVLPARLWNTTAFAAHFHSLSIKPARPFDFQNTLLITLPVIGCGITWAQRVLLCNRNLLCKQQTSFVFLNSVATFYVTLWLWLTVFTVSICCRSHRHELMQLLRKFRRERFEDIWDGQGEFLTAYERVQSTARLLSPCIVSHFVLVLWILAQNVYSAWTKQELYSLPAAARLTTYFTWGNVLASLFVVLYQTTAVSRRCEEVLTSIQSCQGREASILFLSMQALQPGFYIMGFRVKSQLLLLAPASMAAFGLCSSIAHRGSIQHAHN